MPFESLGEYITALEGIGQLKRVRTKVNTDLEIAEILRRLMYKVDQPAVLFENVEGYKYPVLGNAFGSLDRLKIALGLEDFSEIGERISVISRMRMPSTIFGKLKMLPKLSEIADYGPKHVESGPVNEVVLNGNEASIGLLPVTKSFPNDAGKFITFGVTVTKNPETLIQNLGVYRLQVLASKKAIMHWQIHKRGALHYQMNKVENEKTEVAIVIGADPAVVFSAVAAVPEGMDKYLFAGITRKRGIKLVKCKTVDIEVPASSEIVLEGYVDPSEINSEGAFLPLIRIFQPEVTDFSMPAAGWFQGLAIVSIKKRYPGQAKKVMMGLWGMGQLSLTKIFVVVDSDINVHNVDEVIWAITTRSDPKRDTMVIDNTPTDTLDPASPLINLGSKLGIDATTKWKEEGYLRPVQEEALPDAETIQKVTERWKEYDLRTD